MLIKTQMPDRENKTETFPKFTIQLRKDSGGSQFFLEADLSHAKKTKFTHDVSFFGSNVWIVGTFLNCIGSTGWVRLAWSGVSIKVQPMGVFLPSDMNGGFCSFENVWQNNDATQDMAGF